MHIREAQLEENDEVLALFDEYERPQPVGRGRDRVQSTSIFLIHLES